MKYADHIPPRRLKFIFENGVPRCWHINDINTYHFNALALFLPVLERLVVMSLKKALQEVTDPTLKREVASLVAQEAIHGSEFIQYNRHFISPHYHLSSDQFKMRGFRIISGLINKFSHTFHYALSAAGEHFTAISAELFLKDPSWFNGVNPAYSAIWRWHCIEEIEHKTVAYDTFQSVNGNYFIRILGMLLITCVFSMLYIKPIWHMMKQDGNHTSLKFYLSAFKYYWGKRGFCRELCRPFFDYFRPNFHPNHHHNTHLITHWKEFFSHSNVDEIVNGLSHLSPPKAIK